VIYGTFVTVQNTVTRLREFAGVLVYVVLLVSACGGMIEESSGHLSSQDELSTMLGELKLKKTAACRSAVQVRTLGHLYGP